MAYLLDTDICSYFMQIDKWPSLQAKADSIEWDLVSMSVVTQAELLRGVLKAEQIKAKKALFLRHGLEDINQLIPTLALPETAAQKYASLRMHLDSKGTPIGANDMWIAAHALAQDLILVTNNEKEFKRVKGLKIENWVREK